MPDDLPDLRASHEDRDRVADVLQSEYPDWDDDRLFETTRLILTVLELKLVVEEYIRHIGPFDFAIEAVPFIADEERWNRPNQIAIEFNLLYRWHMLVPDQIGGGDEVLKPLDVLNNNPNPSEQGIRVGIEGNLCRCTGYHNIVRAVQTAAGGAS